MTIHTKLIGTIVLGAALLAPVAQAQSPDDRTGMRGPGAVEALQGTNLQHPDNRVEARGPGAVATVDGNTARGTTSNVVVSHPDNSGDARGPGAIEPKTVVVASTSTGFDWRDALIGGIGGMGTALLLTGCLFLLTSQRNKARMA